MWAKLEDSDNVCDKNGSLLHVKPWRGFQHEQWLMELLSNGKEQ